MASRIDEDHSKGREPLLDESNAATQTQIDEGHKKISSAEDVEMAGTPLLEIASSLHHHRKRAWYRRLEWWPCWIGWTGVVLIILIVRVYPKKMDLQQWPALLVMVSFMFLSSWLAVIQNNNIVHKAKWFPISFLFLFLLSGCAKITSLLVADHYSFPLGSSVWASLMGILVINTCCLIHTNVPWWLQSGLQTELYISSSVVFVLLDFETLHQLGAKALWIGWIDTPWLAVFFVFIGFHVFCLPLSDSILMTSVTLISGSSAAVVVTRALLLPRKDGDVCILISLLFTIPQIILLPQWATFFLGHSATSTDIGIWLGGCMDGTGAVIASAGQMNENEVLSVSMVVKVTQNILVVPLGMAIEWFARRYASYFSRIRKEYPPQTCCEWLYGIWHRFPKFILGFVVAQFLFNVGAQDSETRRMIQQTALSVCQYFSICAFACMGLQLRWKSFPSLARFAVLAGFYLVTQIADIVCTGGMVLVAKKFLT